MAFRCDVPAGWEAVNEASRVAALHPEKVAQIELRLAQGASADEAARSLLRQEGVTAGESRRTTVNGLAAVDASFEVARRSATTIAGRALFVEHGGRVFQLVALALEERAAAVRAETARALDSFAPLTERARFDVAPQRVRLVALPRAMSFEDFVRSYPSEERREILELINGASDVRRILPAGTLLKRIEGRKVGVQRIGAPGS
jgi:predicted Zn-dependent protease